MPGNPSVARDASSLLINALSPTTAITTSALSAAARACCSQAAASAYTEDDQTEMITDLETQIDRLREGQRESLDTLELHDLQIKELRRRVGLLPP